MQTIKVYVLHCYWDSIDTHGSEILDISDDKEILMKRLETIKDTKAKSYITKPYLNMTTISQEVKNDWKYEVYGVDGDYIIFYITENDMTLTGCAIDQIMVAEQRKTRRKMMEQYLKELWEKDEIVPWKYEYLMRSYGSIDQLPCGNIHVAVDDLIKGLTLTDKILEFLWDEFGDILIDNEENILDDYLGFKAGTFREEVWHWFDRLYTGGIAKLMGVK